MFRSSWVVIATHQSVSGQPCKNEKRYIDFISLVIKPGTNVDVLHVCIMYLYIQLNSLQLIHLYNVLQYLEK